MLHLLMDNINSSAEKATEVIFLSIENRSIIIHEEQTSNIQNK